MDCEQKYCGLGLCTVYEADLPVWSWYSVTIMQRNSEVSSASPLRSFQSWTISRRQEAIGGFTLICTPCLMWGTAVKMQVFPVWTVVGVTGVILGHGQVAVVGQGSTKRQKVENWGGSEDSESPGYCLPHSFFLTIPECLCGKLNYFSQFWYLKLRSIFR